MLEKPNDREVACRPMAMDFFDKADFRHFITMNITIHWHSYKLESIQNRNQCFYIESRCVQQSIILIF